VRSAFEIRRLSLDRLPVEIMRINKRIVFPIAVSLLCVSYMCSAAASPASSSIVIQMFSESGSLDLTSANHAAALRQTSTPIHITVTGATVASMHPIEVYACLTTEEAMRLAGKSSTLASANLRIWNDRNEWTTLKPMAKLGGRLGVRIAVLYSASARILLQVQLRVPASQAPGTYQGVLTLEALEQ
jgi:hypothetical protein